MKKNILLLVLLLGIKINTNAQQATTTITGIVLTKTNKQPIEFVNVLLLHKKDSSTLKGTITDKKGKFVLENVTAGNYLMRYSYIGYANVTTKELDIIETQKNINVGAVELESYTKNLNEVVVTATKNTLNTNIDRKVYNVNQDIMSKSGSASDILKNIPSVEVDIDGNVALRGSADVMILINGKPSPMMGKSRAEVLQALPANSIERIEVITNPSARYRPDGTSGIINIVLKKNAKRGWNGTATLNAGNKNRYNGGLFFNYNPAKINLFGSFNIRQDNRNRVNNVDRIFFDSTGKTSNYFNEINASSFVPIAKVADVGAEFDINENNKIGISADYFSRTLTKNDVVNKFTNDKQHVLINHYDRLRTDPEFEKQFSATLFFEHKFKKEDNEIRVEFVSSHSNEVEDNHYANVYVQPVLKTDFDNTIIKQKENNNQLTIDYTYPIGEDAKLEAGYDGSFNRTDFDFLGEFFDYTQSEFINDIAKSNAFTYQESLQAVYATYQKSIKSFGYSVGLRAEQVNLKSDLLTLKQQINNSYFKLYPTLHLSYKLKSGNELQLNYSKRVNRADADQLNPFPEYRDSRNLQAGNPYLLPEIINSVELGYKWQNKKYSFVPSIYYRYKTNGFTQVIKKLDDSTFLYTTDNLANDKSAGIELIFSAKFAKFFTANMSSNIFYNQIDASNIGYTKSKSIVSFSTNFNSTFTITKNTMLQLSSIYRSARLTAQGKQFASIVVNLGARQDLFKKKVSLIFTVSDIFVTQQEKREFSTQYLNQTSVNKRDSRIFYIGVSYKFGKTKKAPKEEKLQFDNGG
jgi:outer membrane receptor protein involved in Fe transport